MANDIRLTVNADTKKAEENLGNFSKRLKGIGDSAGTMGRRLSVMGAIGTAAIGALAKAALEQRRVEATLAAAVRSQGDNYEALRPKIMAVTAALQAKTNFGDEEQIRTLTKMITILGSTERGLLALPVALDAATVAGVGLREVSGTLSKALAGNVNQAESVGIKFDKADSFGVRLAKTIGEVGGAAEANADPMIQLANGTGDVVQAFGEGLLPLLEPILEKLTRLTLKLQTVDGSTIATIATFALLAAGLGAVVGPILLVTSAVIKLTVAMIALNATSILLAGKVVAILAAVTAVTAAYVMFREEINSFIGKVIDAGRAVGGFNDRVSEADVVAQQASQQIQDSADHFDGLTAKVRNAGAELAKTTARIREQTAAQEALKAATQTQKSLQEEVIETARRLGIGLEEVEANVVALTARNHTLDEAWRATGDYFGGLLNEQMKKAQESIFGIGKAADQAAAKVKVLQMAGEHMQNQLRLGAGSNWVSGTVAAKGGAHPAAKFVGPVTPPDFTEEVAAEGGFGEVGSTKFQKEVNRRFREFWRSQNMLLQSLREQETNKGQLSAGTSINILMQGNIINGDDDFQEMIEEALKQAVAGGAFPFLHIAVP